MRLSALCVLVSVILCASPGCGGGGPSSGGQGRSGSSPPTSVETSPHAPVRTRYLRTDIQYNPNALQFFPPHVTAYDSVHKRFFVSNTTQNRIDVFDAGTESQIGSILVPLPWRVWKIGGDFVDPTSSFISSSSVFRDRHAGACSPTA